MECGANDGATLETVDLMMKWIFGAIVFAVMAALTGLLFLETLYSFQLHGSQFTTFPRRAGNTFSAIFLLGGLTLLLGWGFWSASGN